MTSLPGQLGSIPSALASKQVNHIPMYQTTVRVNILERVQSDQVVRKICLYLLSLKPGNLVSIYEHVLIGELLIGIQ
jgi:hypothetical protein